MDQELLGYLSASLNKPIDDLRTVLYKKSDDGQEVFNPDGVNTLRQLDTQRVDALKAESKERFDQGYKKAESVVLTAFEKQMREKYAVTDATLQGAALVDHIVQSATTQPLDTAAIKSSQIFIDTERTLLQQIQQQQTDYEARIAQIQGEYQREKFMTETIRPLITTTLDGLNPVYPANPAVKNTIMNAFMQVFNGLEYTQSGDDFTMVRDGQRVENAHSHPVTLKPYIAEKAAEYFEFAKQGQSGNAGNKGATPPASGANKYNSKEEWTAAYFNVPPDQKAAYLEEGKAKGWM